MLTAGQVEVVAWERLDEDPQTGIGEHLGEYVCPECYEDEEGPIWSVTRYEIDELVNELGEDVCCEECGAVIRAYELDCDEDEDTFLPLHQELARGWAK